MKSYFFILGNNQDLSLAELKALFPENNWKVSAGVAWADFTKQINPKSLILKLGGTIKIGEVLRSFNLANRQALSKFIKDEVFLSAEEHLGYKFNFAFSFYGKNIPGDFFKLGLAIKKDLKQEGLNSRLVVSREKALSSVVVEQNKLIDRGIEFCLISEKNKIYLGKTLAVQPFKYLSKRDFGRPKRDDYSGMLPPKLAQIMLNLARRSDNDYTNKTILDPFCGSGTILSEAFLLGFKNIIGSDLSSRAIEDSKKNVDWLILLDKKRWTTEKLEPSFNIFLSDVLDLKNKLGINSVDYIVTEPYLGPQRGFTDFAKTVHDLNTLYEQALLVFYQILKKGGTMVMVWPQFRAKNKNYSLSPSINNFKSIKNLDRLVYGRPGQKVWREILVLTK